MKLYAILPCVLQTIAWAPATLIFKLFCGHKVYGRENLRGLQNAIFACNHSGELDPILLTGAVFRAGFAPMFYVGSPDKEFSDSFFGWRQYIYKGWFFRAWGMYPLVRGAHDYAVSLAAHERIIKDGYNMCIFPEGGVSLNGDIREGKGGVGYLLHATQVPIVPVYIAGTARNVTPGIFSGRKKLSVHFGKPIFAFRLPKSPAVDDFKTIAQETMREIKNLAV
jgi:1-acyl-sn-glycerol-3-phosphate acyltransferase